MVWKTPQNHTFLVFLFVFTKHTMQITGSSFRDLNGMGWGEFLQPLPNCVYFFAPTQIPHVFSNSLNQRLISFTIDYFISKHNNILYHFINGKNLIFIFIFFLSKCYDSKLLSENFNEIVGSLLLHHLNKIYMTWITFCTFLFLKRYQIATNNDPWLG